MRYSFRWLIFILLVAAGLRLYGLNRGDPVSDETLIAFRAIEMVDFDEAEFQTTPLEWFDSRGRELGILNYPRPIEDQCRASGDYLTKFFNTLTGHCSASNIIAQKSINDAPWWTNLSFHDHPPLVFYIQHLFIKIFGENIWAFRLPSVLFGLGSIALIFYLSSMFFGAMTGIFASAALAVTLNHVYVSRIGLQESTIIFLVLLTLYFYAKSLKNPKFLIATGLSLGFALLAKYTTLILLPIIFFHAAIYKRTLFRDYRFYLLPVLAAIIFSPVIIYNVMLYRAAGHFDFQFSYLLNQKQEVWQVEPGKEVGSLGDRFNNFIPRLVASNSWMFLLSTLASILYIATQITRRKNSLPNEYKDGLKFFGITFLFVLIFIVGVIGPSYRFLTMLAPFAAVFVGIFLNALYNRLGKTLLFIPIALLAAFEIFYSVNNQIVYYPLGPMPWLSSKVRFENYNWGYNELGRFFEKEFDGKMPALIFNTRYEFLEKLSDDSITRGKRLGLMPYPAMILYAGNFDDAGRLWTLDRLQVYHGWPIKSLDEFVAALKKDGADYFDKIGFKKYYLVLGGNFVPDPTTLNFLNGLAARPVYNPRGDTPFLIYEFGPGMARFLL